MTVVKDPQIFSGIVTEIQTSSGDKNNGIFSFNLENVFPYFQLDYKSQDVIFAANAGIVVAAYYAKQPIEVCAYESINDEGWYVRLITMPVRKLEPANVR